MLDTEQSDRAFGRQIALEVILRELVKAQLSSLPSKAEREKRRAELKGAVELAVEDSLRNEVEVGSDTFDWAKSAAEETIEAVIGAALGS